MPNEDLHLPWDAKGEAPTPLFIPLMVVFLSSGALIPFTQYAAIVRDRKDTYHFVLLNSV